MMLNTRITDERLKELQARILESCKELDGRTNLRALNVWLVAVEEVGEGNAQEIIDLMLEAGLRGFEWWLLFQVGCSKNAKLFVSIIRLGTARDILGMIPVSMDTERL